MKIIVALLLSLLFLSGCTTKPIQVSTKPVEKAPFHTRDVKWVVITPNNYREVIKKLKASGKSVALFAITDKGYQNLGLNLSDIQTIIRQQQAIIAAYHDYYQPKEEEKQRVPDDLF